MMKAYVIVLHCGLRRKDPTFWHVGLEAKTDLGYSTMSNCVPVSHFTSAHTAGLAISDFCSVREAGWISLATNPFHRGSR